MCCCTGSKIYWFTAHYCVCKAARRYWTADVATAAAAAAHPYIRLVFRNRSIICACRKLRSSLASVLRFRSQRPRPGILLVLQCSALSQAEFDQRLRTPSLKCNLRAARSSLQEPYSGGVQGDGITRLTKKPVHCSPAQLRFKTLLIV